MEGNEKSGLASGSRRPQIRRDARPVRVACMTKSGLNSQVIHVPTALEAEKLPRFDGSPRMLAGDDDVRLRFLRTLEASSEPLVMKVDPAAPALHQAGALPAAGVIDVVRVPAAAVADFRVVDHGEGGEALSRMGTPVGTHGVEPVSYGNRGPPAGSR